VLTDPQVTNRASVRVAINERVIGANHESVATPGSCCQIPKWAADSGPSADESDVQGIAWCLDWRLTQLW